jgi:hypothetical protein
LANDGDQDPRAPGADGFGGHICEEHIFLDKLVAAQTLLNRLMQTLT